MASSDHSAPLDPSASGEVVLPDAGGWISGPSAETVAAQDVEPGDTLLLEDLTQAEVTDTRLGFYQFPGGRALGVAIGWKSGTASGLLIRKATDLLALAKGH